MNQSLIITQLDQAVLEWIENEAQRTGQSIEIIVRRLLIQGLEVARQHTTLQRHHDLDELAGTWRTVDAEEFQRAIDDMNQCDPTLWT